ncbi:N5-glutamine methyltransferase family protein, partial [Ruthenibacterium lactatiformans]
MVTPLAAVRDRLEAAGIPDAAFEAAQLYMLATGRDARLSGGAPLSAFEQKKLDALCEKRCARFPLQYLCGEWDFLDLTLKVGPGVLIPRADTETVAEAAVEAAREAGPGAAVADLCSGTGAIALGVATHVPGARVTAVELSPDALAYLRANNAACGCPLCVVQADVLRWQEECAPGSFDVIVSN